MSLAQNPLTGQMRKSMANFNTFYSRGQNVVSSKALVRKDANSDLQKVHRASFKLLTDFWPFVGGVDGFPVRPLTQSAFNCFIKENLPNAIDASGEAPVIDYPRLVVSKGSLFGVTVEQVTYGATGITLQLDAELDKPLVSPEDVVQVLAKTKAGKFYSFRTVRGDVAKASFLLEIPNATKETMEYLYLFTLTADGGKASNSVFAL